MPKLPERSRPMTFQQRFTEASQDKRVTQREARVLKAHIDHMKIPSEDKQALNQMVDQLEDATNGQFLFFKWRSGINKQEKAGLEALAKENRMAGQLLRFYNEAVSQSPTLDTRITNPQAKNSHRSTPNNVSFPQQRQAQTRQAQRTGAAAPVQSFTQAPAGNMEAELFQAIMNYPGNKATEAEARQIAKTLNEAAQAMGFRFPARS